MVKKPNDEVLKIKTDKENLYRAMGERLFEERKKRKLTQQEAIEDFDCNLVSSTTTWSRYESGTTAIPYLLCVELHQKWGVDLNEFIAGDTALKWIAEWPEEAKTALRILSHYL